jgi:hypothetical protein
MRRLGDDPQIELLELGRSVRSEINGVSHACGAGDRTRDAPV